MCLYIYLWGQKKENAGSAVSLASCAMRGLTEERKAGQTLHAYFQEERSVLCLETEELEMFRDNWSPRHDL